jgi:TonB family protein
MRQGDRSRPNINGRRRAEWTLFLSIVLHTLLLYAVFPGAPAPTDWKPSPKKYVVVRRYRPPRQRKRRPPVKRREQVEGRRKHFKPIPDPSPEEPEVVIEDPEIAPALEDLIPPDAVVIFDAPEGPPQVETPGPMRVPSDVIPPRIIKRVEPRYPDLARKANIQGVVIIEVVISKTGKVRSARVLRSTGNSGLDEAAIEAVKQWEFTPSLLNGAPVEVFLTVTVSFRLT